HVIAGGACGLLAAGVLYLYLWHKDLAALRIPDEDLAENEVVLFSSPGSMVHYKSARPTRFWEGNCGRLFLTNKALEFRTQGGQYYRYPLTVPLHEITQAAPCRILWIFPGGLRVNRADGSHELFTFGVRGNSPAWAAAIMAVRDESF